MRLLSRFVMIVRILRMLAHAREENKSLSVGGQLGAYSNMKRLNDETVRVKKIKKTSLIDSSFQSIDPPFLVETEVCFNMVMDKSQGSGACAVVSNERGV